MPTLAGIDTTKVYHVGFDSEQLKGLRMEQYYVHIDVVKWYEEMLTNRLWEFKCIKIIYERLYHFDINHVKCVEIYYDEQEWRTIAFDDAFEISFLTGDAKYKMPWISNPTYYVHSGQVMLPEIEERLREKDLHKFLIRRYTMEVEWCGKHNLIVYEFEPTQIENLLPWLDYVFYEWGAVQSIFISREFLFLKSTEPPLYKEVENISVLTDFHDQLLSRLSIEDILSLELANKDHRFECHNRDLDRDIQMHLADRLNLANEHTKLDTYYTEFEKLELLKYFVYKYQDRLTEAGVHNKFLTCDDVEDIGYEYRKMSRSVLKNSSIRLDIISTENITVCSVSVQSHDNGNLIEPDSITIKEIRLDSDIRFGLYSEDIAMIARPPYFIEIAFRAKCKSDQLTDFLHTVLEKVLSDFDDESDSIIQLRSYNNRISSCILNSFVERLFICEIGFKNIIFHFNRLVKWLNECSKLYKVSFTGCILLFNNKRSKMLRMRVNENKVKNIDRFVLILTFRNMKFDISTISTFYHINQGDTGFDGCCLTTSSSFIVPLTFTVGKIQFKNMNIDLQLIIPLLSATIEFYNCQIQSNHYQKLQSDLIAAEFLNFLKYLDFGNAIYFFDCPITNHNLIDIWSVAPRRKRIRIIGAHKIDYSFYFKLIAKIYENQFDRMLNDLKDGVEVSLFNLFDIDWSDNPLNRKDIDWQNITIKSVFVDDFRAKLEYFRNDEVFDLFHEQNNLPNDSDECEVDHS